jgi:hypothetical protein
VRLEGLDPGSTYEYEVALGGERVWPALEGMPPSQIHTLGGAGPLEIAFGSCRVALPHEPPFTDGADHENGFEPDALWVLAKQMAESERFRRPDQLRGWAKLMRENDQFDLKLAYFSHLSCTISLDLVIWRRAGHGVTERTGPAGGFC